MAKVAIKIKIKPTLASKTSLNSKVSGAEHVESIAIRKLIAEPKKRLPIKNVRSTKTSLQRKLRNIDHSRVLLPK